MRTTFAGLKLDVPDGWNDITADLPAESPPTLSRADGVGAIQFSVARDDGGSEPAVTVQSLIEWAMEFCATNDFGAVPIAPVEGSQSLCAGGSAALPSATVGVWYLSDGNNVALVTYVSGGTTATVAAGELADAVSLVTSVTF